MLVSILKSIFQIRSWCAIGYWKIFLNILLKHFNSEQSRHASLSSILRHIWHASVHKVTAAWMALPYLLPKMDTTHEDVVKWKYFPRYWPFVRESTGLRWIPITKVSVAELWCFLWSAPKRTVEQTIDASDVRYSLWRHCNMQGDYNV